MADAGFRDIRQGNTSPAADDAAELQSWLGGEFRLNTTAGSPIIGWRCAVAGHPGTWEAIYGGVGGPITLRAAYLAGSVALDQTLPLSDADGGGVIIDGSSGTFTGALSLRINSAAGGPFVVDRANGYVGIGQVTPTAPLEIGVRNGSTTSLLFSQAAHQRIEKTGDGGLGIVIPNAGTPATSYFDVTIGSTSKMRIEPGASGGSNGVFTLNNNGIWSGTFAHWSTGATYITGPAFSGSLVTMLHIVGGALTNQNASVEINDVIFDFSHTVQQTATSHAANRAFKILAPTYSATGAMTVDDAATVYIDGAPLVGTNMTLTRRMALWIGAGGGAGNGGGIRTDGFGATGLLKNNNGGLWTIAAAGTDYMAPWSLTAGSVVISAGGSALTEDAADFTYSVTRSRLSVLNQTVMGSTVGFWLAGGPAAPTLTFSSEDFDTGEDDGPYRDTGFYGIADNMFAVTTGGFPSTVFSSQGIATYGLQARYLYGGTENGRTDESPLVIYGGAGTELLGLQVRATAPFSATSGTQRAVYLNYLGYAGGFAPTSGTAAMRYIDLAYEVNQTGGANGQVRGLNIDATVTALGGTHYLIRAGARSRQYFRIEDQNTSAVMYVGEQATGLSGVSWIILHTNARQAILELDNTSNYFTVYSGGIGATALAGTGTQAVVANASGQLSRSATIPTTGVIPTSTVALTGPAVVWTDGSGLLNVDTARFTYDATNFVVRMPNGSATHPSWTPIGDTNTGMYSHGADSLGVSTGGRLSARFTSDSSSGFEYLTGAAGFAYLGFETTARAGAIYLDNSVGNALISTVPFYVPNGSAGGPSLTFTNSSTTGLYRHSAGRAGMAAAGFLVMHWEATATDRNVWLGEPSSGVTGLAYLGFQTNARTGAIYLDNALGNALVCSVPWLTQNGSAASPSSALLNSTTTGHYRYAADVLGVSTAGRHTFRFASDASSRFAYIGEAATGIAGFAYLGFETNARAGAWYLDNAYGNALICTVPIRVSNDTAIGLSRTSSGIMSLDGTNIDVPSLTAGGMVEAAAGTGRIGIATPDLDFVKNPDEQLHLSYGLDRQGITGSAREHYGALRTVAEGVPQFWLTPMCGEYTAFVNGTHSATNAIEWPLQRAHTHLHAVIYVYSNTYAGTLTFEITVDGAATAATVTVPASTTGTFSTGIHAVGTSGSNRWGVKVTQSTNASGVLVCTVSALAFNYA